MHFVVEEKTEQRLLSDICENFTYSKGVNKEAAALFDAVQQAYEFNSYDLVLVHPKLMESIAACSWVALTYNADDKIPWDNSPHDFILTRTLRFFVSTLRNAILEGRVEYRRNEVFHGCYSIPLWFVEECKKSVAA